MFSLSFDEFMDALDENLPMRGMFPTVDIERNYAVEYAKQAIKRPDTPEYAYRAIIQAVRAGFVWGELMGGKRALYGDDSAS